MVQLSHPHMTTGKTIVLIIKTFVSKLISLFLNMLSRFVILFLPRSKHLLISWLQSPSAVILEPKKVKFVTVFTVSSSICHEVLEPDVEILVFWMLSFKPAFSVCSVHLMKCQAGWSISWNQDCQEKYQQPQICKWYHFNGRKWRGTKESLDEGEIGKQKSWLNSTFKKRRSWHPVPSLHGKQMEKKWTRWQILFWGAPKLLGTLTTATKLKDACSLEGTLWPT